MARQHDGKRIWRKMCPTRQEVYKIYDVMSKAVVNDLLQLRYATTACNNALWLTAVDAIDAL